MNHIFSPGPFAIIAGLMILYWSYILYKTKKNKYTILFVVAVGIICMVIGGIGIFNNYFDGINTLIFGITMTIFLKNDKDNASDWGPLWSWRLVGWGSAIGSIIGGIIIILEDLHILE